MSEEGVHWRRYNKVESWTRMHPDANGEALDIEELVRLGSSGGPCPFYLSRDMASTAQIVFMPYNYLVDAKIRGGIKMLHWDNAVLVFDEAHNVEVTIALICLCLKMEVVKHFTCHTATTHIHQYVMNHQVHAQQQFA